MKRVYLKFNKNWFNLIMFGALSFLFLALFIYFSGVKHSNEAAEQFDKFLKEKFKGVVKVEVLNRLDEIDHSLDQLLSDANEEAKTKITNISKLLNSSEIVKVGNLQERQKLAIQEFEFLTRADANQLYFIQDSKGNILKSATDDRLENINFWNTTDSKGIYFAREIAKAIDYPDGVFVSYNWPKEKNGETLKKTSYCLYIPEFDFIIGTGTYEEDILNSLKIEAYERIQSYYEAKDNYVYILGLDGTVKVHAEKSYVGKKVDSLDNEEIKKAHNIIIEKLKTGNGFVSYEIKKKNSNLVSEKIAYVHKIDKWQVYIGMGFHTVDAVGEINEYTDKFVDDHFKDAVIIIFLLILIAFISYLFIRNGLKLQKEILKQEDIVFEHLLQLTNEGVYIVSNTGEILYGNLVLSKVLKNRILDIFNDPNIYFKHLGKDIYSFKNLDNREYFFKINIQTMLYHGVVSELYIIRDISDEYIRENELQKLAYYDALTNLPNRRKFKNDFEDLLNSAKCYNKNNSCVLAMIDLDKFKIVNDTYGHDMGDKVLKEFGNFITTNIRKSETLYRFGGEEYVIIFKNIDISKAKKILDKINKDITEHINKKFGFPLSFSAGAVLISMQSKHHNVDEYLKEADKLLYQAKRNGRKRVEIDIEE